MADQLKSFGMHVEKTKKSESLYHRLSSDVVGMFQDDKKKPFEF